MIGLPPVADYDPGYALLTIEAQNIKPRDLIAFLNQAKVESVSHIDESNVHLRFERYTGGYIPKVAMVTVLRRRES